MSKNRNHEPFPAPIDELEDQIYLKIKKHLKNTENNEKMFKDSFMSPSQRNYDFVGSLLFSL